MKSKRRKRHSRNKNHILIILILCMVIAAIAIFAIGRIANKETNNQKKLDALPIEYQTVTNDSLKNVINSAGDIDVSVYTDDSVNVLNEAIQNAEDTIKKNASQDELDDSYLNLIKAIQSLQKK